MAGVSILMGGGVLLTSWQQNRLRKKIQQWPTTEATIEGGTFEAIPGGGGSRFGRPLNAPVLAFSYHAGGEYFSGRVALMEFFDDDGQEIIRRMTGRQLEIYYDPQDSTRWFIEDKIAGCRIRQEGLQSEASRTF